MDCKRHPRRSEETATTRPALQRLTRCAAAGARPLVQRRQQTRHAIGARDFLAEVSGLVTGLYIDPGIQEPGQNLGRNGITAARMREDLNTWNFFDLQSKMVLDQVRNAEPGAVSQEHGSVAYPP